jgi:hypothetical protein
MLLRNNKVIGVDDLLLYNLEKYLPPELLNIIADFHNCKFCYENDFIHCNFCNNCYEKYERHLVCKKCNICYPYTKTVIFANRRYDFVLNKHIHCDICDEVKKYSMSRYLYYCDNCNNL